MPVITSRLAWALEVDPAEVIARVNEEAQYRLTADTVRLCNVFGRGDQATITKLPKELIDLIEEYLSNEKLAAATRSVERAEHVRDCFREECHAYHDHFSDEQKLDMVNLELHNRRQPAVRSLCEEGVEGLVVWMTCNDKQEWGLGTGPDWRPEHKKNVEEWKRLIRTFEDGKHVASTKEFNRILAYYGLELCIGHNNDSVHAQDTSAYLTIPDTSFEHVETVMIDDCGTSYVGCRVPVEEPLIAYEVTVPPTPTASQSARFGRMLAKLGVSGWEPASSDEERKMQRKRAEPKLMMLAKVVRYH
ncbi:hypothetical protein LTS10_010279 [Elasticomyces elasticus]|nr:hypothetical protein LTS10_010279 [Elasticomyces elasticus]